MPVRQSRPEGEETEPMEIMDDEPELTGASLTINDRYSEKEPVPHSPNLLKGDGQMVVNGQAEEPDLGLQLTEKDDPAGALTINQPVIEKEIVADMLHEEEAKLAAEPEPEPIPAPAPRKQPAISVEDLELEIKTAEEKTEEEEGLEKGYSDLPPYEPTLDLRDYKYPKTDLLETHGSEKIVQDPAELEANKNQIITTLKNYDITIQKISATVGPTVTLYEIVPAAGVRISRIKNLEDDIALSLAALGIRIIAPIPGKGTIGIEVPNHKKNSGEHEDPFVFRKIRAQQPQSSHCNW